MISFRTRALTIQAVRLLAIALGLAAVASHTLLPPKKLVLHPTDALKSLYSDASWGGKTTVAWVDLEQSHWRCNLVRSEFHPVCGLAISFPDIPGETLDFSAYDTLNIRLKYSGDASRLRISLRNHNPDYSDMTDVDSLKFTAVSLRTSEFTDTTSIHLTEFSVADWWLEERDIPRALSLPERNRIANIGIDFPHSVSFGQHDLQLESIELIGPWISTEQLYLWIILVAAGALIIEAAYRLTFVYRHIRSGAQQLQAYKQAKVLREQAEKYQDLATRDPLTGILNRNGLVSRIEKLFDESHPQSKSTSDIAIILFDLDRFRRVNDRRGHDMGDRALQGIAKRVQSKIRGEDILARWGGEEFIVIAPRITPEAAYNLAEKIRILISTHSVDDTSPLQITASLGVAVTADQETFESAFKRADEALYKAKELGRNCSVLAENAVTKNKNGPIRAAFAVGHHTTGTPSQGGRQ